MTDPEEIKCRVMAELLGVLVCSDKANYPGDTIRLYVNWPRVFRKSMGSDTVIHCTTWAEAIEALQTMENMDEVKF